MHQMVNAFAVRFYGVSFFKRWVEIKEQNEKNPCYARFKLPLGMWHSKYSESFDSAFRRRNPNSAFKRHASIAEHDKPQRFQEFGRSR